MTEHNQSMHIYHLNYMQNHHLVTEWIQYFISIHQKFYMCKLCMVFKPRGFNLKCPDMYMNLNKLAYVKEAKYLGVIICNDLKDDGDILRHLRNFYARSNSIIRKFHHCSVGVKLHLFHAYCCTTYCCQLWVNFNKGSYLNAKVAYNNMHRRILGYSRRDSRVACLQIMLLIHLTPYCVRTFMVLKDAFLT